MGIMPRSSTETAIIMQTREDKVEDVTARESVWLSQEMQGRQSPIEAVETQMFGEPVFELIFALERVSAGLDGWVLARPRRAETGYAQCRGSGCSGRACRRRGASRRACWSCPQHARAQKQETCQTVVRCGWCWWELEAREGLVVVAAWRRQGWSLTHIEGEGLNLKRDLAHDGYTVH